MTHRFWRGATSAGLLVSLIGAGLYGTPLRQGAHAARLAALGCAGGSVTPSPSGGILNGGAIQIHASGLDHSSQAFVTLYDVQNHAQYLTGLTNAQTDSSGNFTATANLPQGGLAGGNDTIIVSDNGPACVSGSFAVSPSVQVIGQSAGYAFSFQGAQFRSASTVTINYIDSAQKTNPVAGLQLPTTGQGQTSGYSLPIPASAAIGDGTLQFVDANGGATLTAPFHYSGPPPPTNTPEPYTYVPPVYSTDVPNSTGSGAPTSTQGPGGGGGGNPGSQGSPISTFTPVTGTPTYTLTPRVGTPGTVTSTPTPTASGSTSFPSSPTSTPTPPQTGQVTFPAATSTPRGGGQNPPPPKGGKPKPVFPTPTPKGGSKAEANACNVKHCLANGNFAQKLTSWTVNSPKQVFSVDSVHRPGSKHAARLTGTKKPATLSQGFTAQPSIHQVSFYFRNTGAKAIAQIVDGKKTLISQQLPTTRGTAFASVVLKLPQKIKAGDTLLLSFSATKGTLFVGDVVVGTPPPPPPPAKKTTTHKKTAPKSGGQQPSPSPTATPHPTASPVRPTATPGKPQPVFPTPTPKTS